MLKQYSALRSYFLSQDENESDCRLSRLQGLFNDPMTEVNLLFYQSVLPVFTKTNLLLQRDSPRIHFLYDAMERVLRTLLGRLVTVTAMDSANTVVEVDFNSKPNQLIDSQLMIGFTTKQVLGRVQDEVQPSKVKKFYNGVRVFYVKCLTYIVDKFAWNDPLLKHVQFVDFEKRKICTFESVQYFLTRFSQLLPSEHTDEVYDEFRLYQSLPEIPPELDKSKIYEEDCIRADILWNELQKAKDVNGKEKFGLVAKVAKLVLILPHSNADEEQIFSIV